MLSHTGLDVAQVQFQPGHPNPGARSRIHKRVQSDLLGWKWPDERVAIQ